MSADTHQAAFLSSFHFDDLLALCLWLRRAKPSNGILSVLFVVHCPENLQKRVLIAVKELLRLTPAAATVIMTLHFVATAGSDHCLTLADGVLELLAYWKTRRPFLSCSHRLLQSSVLPPQVSVTDLYVSVPFASVSFDASTSWNNLKVTGSAWVGLRDDIVPHVAALNQYLQQLQDIVSLKTGARICFYSQHGSISLPVQLRPTGHMGKLCTLSCAHANAADLWPFLQYSARSKASVAYERLRISLGRHHQSSYLPSLDELDMVKLQTFALPNQLTAVERYAVISCLGQWISNERCCDVGAAMTVLLNTGRWNMMQPQYLDNCNFTSNLTITPDLTFAGKYRFVNMTQASQLTSLESDLTKSLRGIFRLKT